MTSRLAQRTVDLLEAVAQHPAGVGLSELSRAAALPKATCLRVLSALEDSGWVWPDPVTRRYRIGLGVLSLVGGLLSTDSVVAQVQAVVRALAEQAGETAGFDMLSTPSVVVLVQVSGPRLIAQGAASLPVRQPVWCTSTGKAMVAQLDPSAQVSLLDQVWSDGAVPADARPRFEDAVRAATQNGWATTVDELEPGASSVAAAFTAPGGGPCSLWVGGPSYRLTRERLDELGPLLRQAADRLAAVLARPHGVGASALP